MEAIQTNPNYANQGRNFMSPGSLSFPIGHNELKPPGEAGLNVPQEGAPAGSPLAKSNGIAPATPRFGPGSVDMEMQLDGIPNPDASYEVTGYSHDPNQSSMEIQYSNGISWTAAASEPATGGSTWCRRPSGQGLRSVTAETLGTS